MLVPDAVGTVSSSIWAILGTVNLRVLSFGPLAASPSLPVSSLGTLKLPGSELFVAMLSRLPARKKDAMRAAPAAIMTRLNAQETMFLVRDFFIILEIVTSGLRAFTKPEGSGAPS